jgi:hypothetical protein
MIKITTDKTPYELRRERAKEIAHLFYVMTNIMLWWGIGSEILYYHNFNFETGILTVMVILVDFCITYGLIDIVEPFERF